MGTTLNSLQDGGAQIGFVLAIEGYSRLITNGDPSAALTAWDGEDFDGCVPGLKIKGRIKQRWEPWAKKLDGNPLTFLVMPDESDHFGKAVFKGKPSKETRLTSLFSASASGGNMGVQNANDFAAGDAVFVGGEAMEVGSTSTGQLTFNANKVGMHSPFTSDGNSVFPKPHVVSARQSLEMSANPKVTDVQRNWIGKWVALYVHRIVDGVWDTRDQAQLIYAGQIKAIQDDGMHTVVETTEVRQRINDTVLLRDQFRGIAKEGLRLIAGDKFKYLDFVNFNGSGKEVTLSVVESGANGADHTTTPEINEGYYKLGSSTDPEEGTLLDVLNTWLATQAANSNTNLNPSITLVAAPAGLRVNIKCTRSSSADLAANLGANRREIMMFMGFRESLHSIDYIDGFHFTNAGVGAALDSTELAWNSEEAPFKVWAFQNSGTAQGSVMEMESTEGTWWDQTDWLPYSMRPEVDGDDRGFLMVGDKMCFAKHDSDTLFTEVRTGQALKYEIDKRTFSSLPVGLRIDEAGDLEVRQAVIVVGGFREIMGRIFASIEGNGENNATYDEFPAQMSARIPWGLLGDNFIDSLNSILLKSENDTLAIRLTEPTDLLKILMPEMTLRMATLTWVSDPDSGSPGLQFRSFQMPNAATADHALDETNKAAPAGTVQDLTTKMRISQDWLRNVIKVKYNYGLDDEPRETLTVRDQVSVDENDTQRPVTINARNSFGDLLDSGDAVEAKVGQLATDALPSFAKPIRLLKRTVIGDKFFMTPGDSLRISDDRVRDPYTGERGLSNRAATLLGITYSFGGEGQDMLGEIECLMSLEDRVFPYAPTADVDETESSGSYSAGYDSGNKRLKLKQHAHSQSADDNDVTNFETGDAIRIVERDPENPDDADSFTDTIAAKSDASDYIDLTTGFGNSGNPSFDSSKIYTVTYDDYGNAGSDQKLKAFQADDADGEIVDAAKPNLWAVHRPRIDFASVAATEAPAIISTEHYGDGKPWSVGIAKQLARNANAGQSYLSAPQMSSVYATAGSSVGSTSEWQVMFIFPAPIGVTHIPGGKKRMLNIAVYAAGQSSGSGSTVRVTTSRRHASGDTYTGTTINGPKRSVQWDFDPDDTWVVSSTKQLEPIPSDINAGMTWLLVEGTGYGLCRGFATMYMGPLEDV